MCYKPATLCYSIDCQVFKILREITILLKMTNRRHGFNRIMVQKGWETSKMRQNVASLNEEKRLTSHLDAGNEGRGSEMGELNAMVIPLASQ